MEKGATFLQFWSNLSWGLVYPFFYSLTVMTSDMSLA
jgi:hypothetical protein